MTWSCGQFALAVLGVLWAIAPIEACPSMCSCKWKGGKEWVECANRNLKGLPQGAREETQVLDLSNNYLISLQSECFFSLKLINLQKLFLRKANISHVDPNAFVGLVGLVELDLSNNLIEDVPSSTFASYQALMKLTLSGNPIRELRRGAFQALPQLTNLELSNCQLRVIEQGAFNGLNNLERLYLDGNELIYMPETTLPAAGTFHGLTLQNNPWHCNCRLRGLQAWLNVSAPNMPQESQPVCNEPSRLHGQLLKSVKVQDLACRPTVTIEENIETYEGGNVTVRCEVHAIPPATVTWWIKGELCEFHNENDTISTSGGTAARYSHFFIALRI